MEWQFLPVGPLFHYDAPFSTPRKDAFLDFEGIWKLASEIYDKVFCVQF